MNAPGLVYRKAAILMCFSGLCCYVNANTKCSVVKMKRSAGSSMRFWFYTGKLCFTITGFIFAAERFWFATERFSFTTRWGTITTERSWFTAEPFIFTAE